MKNTLAVHSSVGPARIDRDRQRQRKNCGNEGADVRDEAKDSRENAPQHRAWNSDQPERHADQEADPRIERELSEEKSAEPARRVVERAGGLLQVVRPRQLDQAIAQLFTLHQRKDDEDEHDAGRGQRMQQRRNQCRDAFQRRRWRLAHFDRDRLGVGARRRRRWRCSGRFVLRLVQFLAKVLKDVGCALQRACGGCRASKRLNLGPHIGFVAGQLARQLCNLRGDHPANGKDCQKRECSDADDRSGPWHAPAFEAPDDGGQHEAQQNGERDRDEHIAAKVQRRHDERCQQRRGHAFVQLEHAGVRPCQSRCFKHARCPWDQGLTREVPDGFIRAAVRAGTRRRQFSEVHDG